MTDLSVIRSVVVLLAILVAGLLAGVMLGVAMEQQTAQNYPKLHGDSDSKVCQLFCVND